MQAQEAAGVGVLCGPSGRPTPRKNEDQGREGRRRSHGRGYRARGLGVGSGGTRLESQYNYLKTGFGNKIHKMDL